MRYFQLILPLSPYRHKEGDCGVLVLRAVEISDGTRDRVTLGGQTEPTSHHKVSPINLTRREIVLSFLFTKKVFNVNVSHLTA